MTNSVFKYKIYSYSIRNTMSIMMFVAFCPTKGEVGSDKNKNVV